MTLYEKVAIDDEPTNGSVCNSEVISPSFFGRPFSSGALQKSRWNPFKKKSGILGVIHAQSKRNRVVSKHGKLNTFRRPEENGEQHRYLKDFFTSMIDLSWSWTLFSFATSFFFSWLVFAVLWYLLALLHGDLVNVEEWAPEHRPCVENIKDFTSCFLFSIETQHTIGYGVRATTEQCSGAIVIMSIQCIVGVVIQACMAGIVFAKFTKPTMRAETILFSKNALITMRNGSLYLICRIGDLRPTHLLESHVSGQMVKREVTEEGEEIPYHLERMEFGTELDGSQDFFQMFWPITVSHKIDEESPLWEMSPRDILQKQFEIILTMEGITPETGNTIQVRTSYLPNEILWGYRFEHNCVSYDKDAAKYAVSLTGLNKFQADKTPRCSAKEWEETKARAALVQSTNRLEDDRELPAKLSSPARQMAAGGMLGVADDATANAKQSLAIGGSVATNAAHMTDGEGQTTSSHGSPVVCLSDGVAAGHFALSPPSPPSVIMSSAYSPPPLLCHRTSTDI